MRKAPYMFVPKFNNRYQVTIGDTSIVTNGTSRRGVLMDIIGDTTAMLKSVGGRTAVYDTRDGVVSITRLGRGERIVGVAGVPQILPQVTGGVQ